MTKEELDKLTPEQKRIAIAQACGWTEALYDVQGYGGKTGQKLRCWVRGDMVAKSVPRLPDYLNDLNAMHAAEKHLFAQFGDDLAKRYTDVLRSVVCPDYWIDRKTHHAKAAQRADAFLLTL